MTRRRAEETDEVRAARLTRDAPRVSRRRVEETDEERAACLADNTEREARRRTEEIPHHLKKSTGEICVLSRGHPRAPK